MTDEALEAAIDEVGRTAVFNRAAAYGWGSGNPPPKYVWWQIIEELKQATPMQHTVRYTDTRPLHEQVLGFRLW